MGNDEKRKIEMSLTPLVSFLLFGAVMEVVLKFLFMVVSVAGLITSIVCFVVILVTQKEIKLSPADENLKRQLASADRISRGALFFTAIFYFLFKFFGDK